VETLIALGILGVVVPASLNAFGVIFLAEIRLRELTRKASGAEWWFSRLDLPVSQAGVDAMPREEERGKMRFSWETEKADHGALRVTLRVSNGAPGDVPFVMTRVY
jgi:hypothetical protein